MQENIAIDSFAGHETIAAKGIEPFDDRFMERRIDDGMRVKTPGTRLGLIITTRHFKNFDRLAAFLTLDRMADHHRIRERRPLAISAQATGMDQDVSGTVGGINEAITPRRIIPFNTSLKPDDFRILKNVVR